MAHPPPIVLERLPDSEHSVKAGSRLRLITSLPPRAFSLDGSGRLIKVGREVRVMVSRIMIAFACIWPSGPSDLQTWQRPAQVLNARLGDGHGVPKDEQFQPL